MHYCDGHLKLQLSPSNPWFMATKQCGNCVSGKDSSLNTKVEPPTTILRWPSTVMRILDPGVISLAKYLVLE